MIVAGDFETTWSQDYSVSRMTTAEYILDHRFQLIMLSLKIDDNPSEILIGEVQIRTRLAQLNWAEVAWLSHNAAFDGAILLWRLGFTPAMYLCTLSMARAITHWVIGKSALAQVSEYLGLPPKGKEVFTFKGKRLENFNADELVAYANYCIRDNENCRLIFDKLRPHIPNSELRLIDLIVRMHVQPQVKLNPNVLAEHLHQVRAEKQAILDQVGYLDPAVLSSQPKFAALLEQMGVEVPMKTSPATGLPIPALSKNDRGFRELLVDDQQPLAVQALLAARTQAKSTIEETRSERFLKTSMTNWPGLGTGWAPIPLKYYGARTGRLSGNDLTNWQNLKRGSRIREAIEAPPGMRIVHRDASQIEARMVAWMADCQHLLDAFANKRDVYSEFASIIYGVPVTAADKLRRFVGKTAILGLGYGCGPDKFRHMLYIGNGGLSMKVDEDEAQRIVYAYRDRYMEIPRLWHWGGNIIDMVVNNSGRSSHKLLVGSHRWIPIEVGYDSVWLPNGMCLSYPDICYRVDDTWDNRQTIMYRRLLGDIMYRRPLGDNNWAKIYGSKFIENLSQALSRIIVTDIAVRMYDLTGYHPFLSTHDSLDYCVPLEDAEWWDHELSNQFSMRPSWASNLPLASEGGWGGSLLAAERGVNK